MYAVIFKAEIHQLDQEYSDTAARLRNLAIENTAAWILLRQPKVIRK